MDARGSTARVAVLGDVTYSPDDLPRVDVLVAAEGDSRAASWTPGVLLRGTERTDGTWLFYVRYALHGHEFVEALKGDRIRHRT